jgi:site-specific DNA-adenine methylase
MAAPIQFVSVNLTVDQIRNLYQVLKDSNASFRREMASIFNENNAEWKYQLPADDHFRFCQLEDRELWACQTMGILAAAAREVGVVVEPY